MGGGGKRAGRGFVVGGGQGRPAREWAKPALNSCAPINTCALLAHPGAVLWPVLATAHDDDEHPPTMPERIIKTEFPLIDTDPHASRVVRYFRPTDYAVWAGGTAAFPAALYFWGVCTCTR